MYLVLHNEKKICCSKSKQESTFLSEECHLKTSLRADEIASLSIEVLSLKSAK